MLSEKTSRFERMRWRWNRVSTSFPSCCDAQLFQETSLSDAAVGTMRRRLTEESPAALLGVLASTEIC